MGSLMDMEHYTIKGELNMLESLSKEKDMGKEVYTIMVKYKLLNGKTMF
jgi:hypothetical protein